ncbi:thiamine-phosphate kinase [Psychromonas sp. psych-6C06]|uniref:thiamine-phosphate kinase n=1 Tax=Psychromonas sp. psych-6C06 TaxID=2058089 RepID=UPI000C31F0B1|nr:thiamine-phosphate kinase [Psychromonas sp. psych-6C06]PKF63723.1 thiamine-phosphate kinase [Psychromonas sp. psych-6C06]
MSLGEFDVITHYFKLHDCGVTDSGVDIGIGDDCAILDIPDGCQLAVTTDTLVAGVHFFEDVCPYRLGYKSLAVNLSDLAAMGATPKWVSLAITLPNVETHWLSEFSRGFFDLANKQGVQLVGGDTTKGPLSITVSAKGIVSRNKALKRNGAKQGDLICVSGDLGNGALGLAHKLENRSLINSQFFVDALELTEPRNELGMLLVNQASSCIDISDGLLQDLQHILDASKCSAHIKADALPFSNAMQQEIEQDKVTQEQAYQYALSGGDDYELLFTLSPDAYQDLLKQDLIDKITVIGDVLANEDEKIRITQSSKPLSLALSGWDHFKK